MSTNQPKETTPAASSTPAGSKEGQGAKSTPDSSQTKNATTDASLLLRPKLWLRSRIMLWWKDALRITFSNGISAGGWMSDYQSVNKMLKHLELRKSNSLSTKRSVCYYVARLCQSAKVDPDRLVTFPKETVEEMLREFQEAYFKQTGYGRSTNQAIAYLNTFFRQNGFNKESGTALRFSTVYQAPRSRKMKEYIPSCEEAIRMAETYGRGTRNYVIILFLFFTGVRNATMRSIRYGDIRRELETGFENIKIPVYPEMKHLVPNACKNNISYYVFTSKMLTDAIKQYIAARKEKYGSIPDSAPLFNTHHNLESPEERNLTPLSTNELQHIVKNAAKNSGLEDWQYVTPHKLRKTFLAYLRSQPYEIRFDDKDQEFSMGHLLPGSQDTYVDKSKVEVMRSKWAKFILHEDPVLKMLKIVATELKIDPAIVRAKQCELLRRDPTVPEEIDFLRKLISERKTGVKTAQRVVVEEELQRLLVEGWRVQCCLPSGKVVVTKNESDSSVDPVSAISP